MKLTEYDKARLIKWADALALEHINRGDNINPFLKAANWMIRDSYRLSLDIGGGITPRQIEKFFEVEYLGATKNIVLGMNEYAAKKEHERRVQAGKIGYAIRRGKQLEEKARPPFGGLIELSRLTPAERKEYREIVRKYGKYSRPRTA